MHRLHRSTQFRRPFGFARIFGGVSATVAAGAMPLLAPASVVSAQQADLSVSPFVSFLPTTGASPLAGLGLTLAGNSRLALRASGHLSLENQNDNTVIGSASWRPWGADADALLFLGGQSNRGYHRTIAPFVFTGLGVNGSDSVGVHDVRNNWSYGAGLTVPIGSAVEMFGESRWRMSRFVLPTAHFAPSPTTELRFGLSFHVGNGGGSPRGGRSRDRQYGVGPIPPAAQLPAAISATTPLMLPTFVASRTSAFLVSTSASTLSSTSTPMSTPTSIPTSTSPASATRALSPAASRLLGTADEYVGVPYRSRGTSPSLGFDGSGFTQFVFGRQGVRLPATAQEQAQVGERLTNDWSAVVPGDLLMFEEGGHIEHVAIYAGNNRIIHSSASGGGVRYDDLGTPRGEWFVDHMVAARRVGLVASDARTRMLALAKIAAPAAEQGEGDAPDHAPKPR